MATNIQQVVAERLQTEGRASFNKGNYKSAVDKFSEAIDMRPLTMISLLDNRAAAYEKLGNLKDALADAKHMMKYEKMSPKGYLRAGKVLLLMNKIETAVDVYKYGLRQVPQSNPNYKLLEGMHTKGLERQAQKIQKAFNSKHDPFNMLPLEIIEMIMFQVPFTTLVSCQRVSKSWNNILSNNYPFWGVIDFSGAKRAVKTKSLMNCIRKSKNTVKKATLNRIANLDETITKDLLRICKDLEYLRIVDGFMGKSLNEACEFALNLTTLILQCEIPFSTLVRFIQPDLKIQNLECTKIAKFSLHDTPWSKEPCRSYKRVVIDFWDRSEDKVVPDGNTKHIFFRHLLDCLREVVELHTRHITSDVDRNVEVPTSLQSFSCTYSAASSFFLEKFPKTLQNLDLRGSRTNLWLQSPPVTNPEEELPSLVSLNLGSANIKLEGLINILPPRLNSPLKRLDLSWCQNLDMTEFLDIFMKEGIFVKLETLSVEGCYEFDDRSVKKLIVLPKLHYLNASITGVTGSGILYLINNTKSKLTELELHQCFSISAQLMEFISKQGINLRASTQLKIKKIPLYWNH